MARISSQGLVDDGSLNLIVGLNLTVARNATVGGAVNANTVNTNTVNADAVNAGYYGNTVVTVVGSSSVTFATPGFYKISASGTVGVGDFTGSVPSPATYPGASLMIIDALGLFSYLLTGSAVQPGRSLFCKLSDSVNAASASLAGTSVSVTPGGSIYLISDSIHWLITGGSGSYTMSGPST